MEVYVLKAIRFDNSVSLTTGEWRHQPTGYEILKGSLVESKNMIRNNIDTLVHIVNINGQNMFFEEYFETEEEVKQKYEELTRYLKHGNVKINF